jgi:hypothetical protein
VITIKEIHKYNIPLGKEMDMIGITGRIFEDDIDIVIPCLNTGIRTCYYWPVRVYEAI